MLGLDRVRKEDGMYAFFMEAASIEYHVERYCDLKQLGGLLDSKGYGIALPKDSPYTAAISAGVLSLQEDGVLKAEWAHSESEIKSEISLAPALFCPKDVPNRVISCCVFMA